MNANIRWHFLMFHRFKQLEFLAYQLAYNFEPLSMAPATLHSPFLH